MPDPSQPRPLLACTLPSVPGPYPRNTLDEATRASLLDTLTLTRTLTRALTLGAKLTSLGLDSLTITLTLTRTLTLGLILTRTLTLGAELVSLGLDTLTITLTITLTLTRTPTIGAELASFVPDMVIFNAGGFPANRYVEGMT